MVKVYNSSPYYDDVNEELAKGINSLLFNPGRVIQSREANLLQSLLSNSVKQLGDSIYTEGDIIEGLSSNYDPSSHKLTIGPGKVYLDGTIMSTDGATLTIGGSGRETVNASVVDTLIKDDTEFDMLKDPAVGYDNEGKLGADRNSSAVSFSTNNPNLPVIYNLVDGEVIEDTSEKTKKLNDTLALLAQRTYEESGNYSVSGLEVQQPSVLSQDDPNKIKLLLKSGLAYIKGYRVNKIYDTEFYINRALTTQLSTNEEKNYINGTLSYLLNNQWVTKIDRVVIDTYVKKMITRGPVHSGNDLLISDGSSSVISILSVSDSSRTYVEGSDYTLQSDNSTISWSSTNGNEPSTGSSYSVELVIRTTVDPTMYSLVRNTDDSTRYTLKFTNDAPVPYVKQNTQFTGLFTIEYTYGLPRVDSVYLDSSSDIVVIEGVPALIDNLIPPLTTRNDLLKLADVVSYPNGTTVSIKNSDSTHTTMEDLKVAIDRLNQLEDNVAITNLDRAAQAGEDATLLSGILTDNFTNLNKADVSHKDFSGTFDVSSNKFTTGSSSDYIEVDIDDTNPNNSYEKIGGFVTPHLSDTKIMVQPNATGTVLVNEYKSFSSDGVLDLAPAVDNWVDKKSVTNYREENIVTGKVYIPRVTPVYSWYVTNGEKTVVNKNTVTESIEPFMRQTVVKVTGTNFDSNKDNYAATFNGQLVPLTPLGTTLPGTKSGTVQTDFSGKFTASFVVPENVPCGTVKVVVKNDTSEGSSMYTAVGTLSVSEFDATKYKYQTYYYDPVAETFSPDRSGTLKKVHLFFSTKDSVQPVIVQIKNTVNHLPGDTVLSQAVLYPEDINLSEDGSAETEVVLNDLVPVDSTEDYALAILSNSDKYSLFKSTMNEKIISTNSTQIKQPYSNGTLFTSANNKVWTEDQYSDLKFGITMTSPSSVGRVLFKTIHYDKGFDSILLLANNRDKIDSSIKWTFSIDNGKNWVPFTPWSEFKLQSVYTDIMYQAVLDGSITSSTSLEWDNLGTVLSRSTGELNYISRNVAFDNKYTGVKVTISSNLNSDNSSSQHVYYSNDIDGTTWNEIPFVSIKQTSSEIGNESCDQVYEIKGSNQSSNFRVRIESDKINGVVPILNNYRAVTKI